MKIAVNTDFYTNDRDIPQILRAIGEAGFTHLHWCHHWGDDYFYAADELDSIKKSMRSAKVELLDVHGSDCVNGMCWYSPDEESRKRGVELVRNRLEMMDRLEASGALMMHVPFQRVAAVGNEAVSRNHFAIRQADALRRSLDELMPELERFQRVAAIENMWGDTWGILEMLFAAYPADRVGLCYDSGHANAVVAPGNDALDRSKERLQALHLHDNDGRSDQHQPPYYGTVDWARLAGIIGTSGYPREISFEMSMKATPFAAAPGTVPDAARISAYLADAYLRCARFTRMVETVRDAHRAELKPLKEGRNS